MKSPKVSENSSDDKSNMSSIDTIDLRKPVVKDFVDKNQQVIDFIQTRVPHVPYATPKISCVYTSHDKANLSFRINWFTHKHEGVTITNHLVKSQYVKILVKGENEYEIVTID